MLVYVGLCWSMLALGCSVGYVGDVLFFSLLKRNIDLYSRLLFSSCIAVIVFYFRSTFIITFSCLISSDLLYDRKFR